MKRVLVSSAILLLLSGGIGAVNRVDVIPSFGYIAGDTIGACAPGEFKIYIENDALLSGITLGFRISSPDGVKFTLYDGGDFPIGGDPRFLRGVEGSRWMSGDDEDGSCWDLGGTSGGTDYWTGRDGMILIGGAALSGGLQPGPLQHMIGIMGIAEKPVPGEEVWTLCIDSTFVPPAGEFVFNPGGRPQYMPGGEVCYPVATIPASCPYWDSGNPTSMPGNIGDTSQVTLSAFSDIGLQVYYYLIGTTGVGEASVGEKTGLVTYIPDSADLCQNPEIEVRAVTVLNMCEYSCVSHSRTIEVLMATTPLKIDCGRQNNNIAVVDGVFGKPDIVATNIEQCGSAAYFLESVNPSPYGAYSLDGVMGEFLFTPVWPDDAGLIYEFCIGSNDDYDTALCCFQVEVYTANYPGDVNFMDEVNIADAVLLVNYVFKGGIAPVNMNWADVNADCTVNIADAVYIVQFVFQGGPGPLLGCVYQ